MTMVEGDKLPPIEGVLCAVEGRDDFTDAKPKRERMPRVPRHFKKAIEAGLPARLEKRPDGTVIVEIGPAGPASEQGAAINEWDEVLTNGAAKTAIRQ